MSNWPPDLIDFEGVRAWRKRFYFLKNEAVLLELALQQYAVNTLMRAGFTPTTTPDMARNDILRGAGYVPRGNETQIYSIENTPLSMVATAEITLGGLMADRTVEAEKLPIRLCGISHCFRTEAGAAGRASRGLYRVHQFTKIEMFAFTLPNQSEAMHRASWNGKSSTEWGSPTASSIPQPGSQRPAYRKYDLEFDAGA